LSEEILAKAVFEAREQQLLMPVFIRDYTDFYSSKNHAFNVGCMFRDP
jgi:fumarylacetoacetase